MKTSSIVSDDFGTLLDIKLTQRRNVQLEPCRSAYARWRPSTVAPMFGRAWPNPLPNAPAISFASSLLAWAMLTGQKDALGSGGEEDAHYERWSRRERASCWPVDQEVPLSETCVRHLLTGANTHRVELLRACKDGSRSTSI